MNIVENFNKIIFDMTLFITYNSRVLIIFATEL